MLDIGRLPRPLRLALYGLAVAILLWLTIAPRQDLPDTGFLNDKAQHALGWFALALCGLILAPRRLVAIALFALTLGVAVEVIQANTPYGRQGDWRDFVADAVGVAAAVAVRAIWRNLRR